MEFLTINDDMRKLIVNDNITELKGIKDIDILHCKDCNSLTSIPNIMIKKYFVELFKLTSIPNIKGLKILYLGIRIFNQYLILGVA